MLNERGIQGLRVLQGLLALTRTQDADALEKACERALSHGAYRLQALRRLLEHQNRQVQLDFIDEHPLIRRLSVYGRLATFPIRPETPPDYAPKTVRLPPSEEAPTTEPPLRLPLLKEELP
jgi:hypothetical protein